LIQEYETWTQRKDAFEAVSVVVPLQMQAITPDGPELLSGGVVPSQFFAVAGIDPVIGRAFTAEEDQPSGKPVVILGHNTWQRFFAGQRDILGESIRLRDTDSANAVGQSFTVIGILPPGFGFPSGEMGLLLPLRQDMSRVARYRPMRIYGRVRPGVDAESAAQALAHIQEDLTKESKDLYEHRVPVITPLHDQVTGTTGRVPVILMSAVVFVLFIALANVANLSLVQSGRRKHEMAVRFSVGASRWRIVRQLLTESLILSVTAGLLGLICTSILTQTIAAFVPQNVPRLHPIGVDWRVAVFTVAVSIISGVLFGVYPAWAASQHRLARSLQLRGGWSGPVLSVVEVGLAVILCIGAGLLLKSFVAYLAVDNGVNPGNVAMFHIPTSGEFRDATEVRVARYRALIDAVSAVPGVAEVAVSSNVPMVQRSPAFASSFSVTPHPLLPAREMHAIMTHVSPNYFDIMGLPILRGRAFNSGDSLHGAAVVIVSEQTARLAWPGQDPIGKTMTAASRAGSQQVLIVVGVVKDVTKTTYQTRISGIFGEGFVYLPIFGDVFPPPSSYRFLVLRSHNDPRAIATAVRKAILGANPNQSIASIDFFDDVLYESQAAHRFRSFLIVSFAAIALLIAGIGVYGVVSHSVAMRTHEMGVRIALGARRLDILRLVVGSGVVFVLAGIFAGTLASLGLTKFIAAYLFQTEPFDAPVFAGIDLLFSVIAVIACWIPAQRAAKADPVAVIRGF
jgi:putative ABC transport system permease protein